MSVKINIPLFLQSLVGDVKVVDVTGDTVGECLNDLVSKFPEIKKLLFDTNGELHHYINILVNGESVYFEQLTKPVADGAELFMLYIIAGG